jgi:hypothetical protein
MLRIRDLSDFESRLHRAIRGLDEHARIHSRKQQEIELVGLEIGRALIRVAGIDGISDAVYRPRLVEDLSPQLLRAIEHRGEPAWGIPLCAR